MKERPIIFSVPMVRAILAGRKTQERGIAKNIHVITCDDKYGATDAKCPYGQPGDRLWVRECFARDDLNAEIYYRADYTDADASDMMAESTEKWRSPTHMPRVLSRITLEIVSVRVQQLQTISEYDAMAEGVAAIASTQPDWDGKRGGVVLPAVDVFAKLWNEIHGELSWAENPWVWVLEFKRVRQEPRGVVKETAQ